MSSPVEQPQPKRAAEAAWRKKLRDVTPLDTIKSLGVALAALVAMLGGWNTVTAGVDKTLPALAPGEAIAAAPFTLEVREAFWARSRSPLLLELPDQRWLVVSATVTLEHDSPISTATLAKALVREVDGERVAANWVYRPEPAAHTRNIQPGLTGTWEFAWQVPAGEGLPAQLRLLAQRQTYRESSLGDGLNWLDATPSGAVEVPLDPVERVQ